MMWALLAFWLGGAVATGPIVHHVWGWGIKSKRWPVAVLAALIWPALVVELIVWPPKPSTPSED